jgi:hypothetical protein
VLIKVLFAVMCLSLVTLAGVSVAVFVRVRSHLKRKREQPEAVVQAPPKIDPSGTRVE